ncbi:hypothetical protein SAMN04488564_102777 [Lentzea waywayandensis]|uniref:Uncharacterized protein n=1 Tax=Lentzea waywayandensis TaxID=84724 RepID=A0A1I6DIS8_9PSEU|nr:hypothetical protein SAMN04488564_102777 [Lentzea waywayandensis]
MRIQQSAARRPESSGPASASAVPGPMSGRADAPSRNERRLTIRFLRPVTGRRRCPSERGVTLRGLSFARSRYCGERPHSPFGNTAGTTAVIRVGRCGPCPPGLTSSPSRKTVRLVPRRATRREATDRIGLTKLALKPSLSPTDGLRASGRRGALLPRRPPSFFLSRKVFRVPDGDRPHRFPWNTRDPRSVVRSGRCGTSPRAPTESPSRHTVRLEPRRAHRREATAAPTTSHALKPDPPTA